MQKQMENENGTYYLLDIQILKQVIVIGHQLNSVSCYLNQISTICRECADKANSQKRSEKILVKIIKICPQRIIQIAIIRYAYAK